MAYYARQENPVAALVGAFGKSFSDTVADDAKSSLLQKHYQDAAMAETILKSGIENPDLWNNDTYNKAATSILGKDGAGAARAQAEEFARSPMGILHKAFGATINAPMEMHGPDESGASLPSVPFGALPLDQQQGLARDRYAAMTPAGVGQAFGPDQGALQARTQELAARGDAEKGGITPAVWLAHEDRAAAGARADAANAARLALQERGEKRRTTDQSAKLATGNIRMLETAMGPLQVRETFNPATNQLEIIPIGRKREPVPNSMIDKFQNLNTGLRYTDEISRFIEKYPEEARAALFPFAGQKLAEVNENLSTLTPRQQRFIRQMKELAVARISFQGGKALTENEQRIYSGVLPTLNVGDEKMLGIITEDTRQALTAIGADTENILDKAGHRMPPGSMVNVNQRNRPLYKNIRRRLPEFPTGVPTTTAPPPSAAADTPAGAAVRDAFMAP